MVTVTTVKQGEREVAITIGMILAIIALVLGVLMVVAVIPVTAQTVGGLVILLALARLS